MKKLLIAALITASLATSAFAKETNKISFRTDNNFHTQFDKAQNVSWTIKDNFTKASFDMNGEKLEAFYNLQGEMIGTSRNISITQLPAEATKAFTKHYGGYTLKEAIHFEGTEEDAYYLSAENEKEALVLKVSNNSNISIFKKTKLN